MASERPAVQSPSPASELAGVGLCGRRQLACKSLSPASKLAGVACVLAPQEIMAMGHL